MLYTLVFVVLGGLGKAEHAIHVGRFNDKAECQKAAEAAEWWDAANRKWRNEPAFGALMCVPRGNLP
jgi:hypothetical protein